MDKVFIVEKEEQDDHSSYWVVKEVCASARLAHAALTRIFEKEATEFLQRPVLPPGTHRVQRQDGSWYWTSDDWVFGGYRIKEYEVTK